MVAEHTPGPWTTSRGDLGLLRLNARPSERGRTLHLATFAEASDDDARLIAAAPDLLAALEELQAWVDKASDLGVPLHLESPVCADARAAIAKAKGDDGS